MPVALQVLLTLHSLVVFGEFSGFFEDFCSELAE